MKKITVSIITPVYRAEKCLHRCIESILAQSFTDWELLLIDDGSPDNSGTICDEYALKDSRIKSFHQQNSGPSAARNYGLEKAIGDFIVFVDSDDYIDASMLQDLVIMAEQYKVDLCFFELNPVSENHVQAPYSFSSICHSSNIKIYLDKDECAEAIVGIECSGGMGWTCNKLFKHSIIQEHQIRFDHRFTIQEDHLFTLSYLCYVNSLLVTTYSPYNYVMTAGSLLSKNLPFKKTKELNNAMYVKRCDICRIFNIRDNDFIKWFKTDYATRIVANLLQMKGANLSREECIHEVEEVNIYINKEHVHPSGKCKYYDYIKWLPSWVIVKLLHC